MSLNSETNQSWSNVITSKNSLFSLNLSEVWRYRDLVYMLVEEKNKH